MNKTKYVITSGAQGERLFDGESKIKSRLLTRLAAGTIVEVLQENARPFDDGKLMTKVKTPYGITGWVDAKHVKVG